MASHDAPVPGNRQARAPFYFQSLAAITRIAPAKAATLGELLGHLRNCPDASVFYHTFQSLREHHFIREGFSNDFAHWAFAACNEIGLAERLAAVDVRDFTSIQALRERFVSVLEAYLAFRASAATRPAFEPFYFLASETVVVPTPFVAHDLAEFADCLERVSGHSIYYHFVAARLRLMLNSNDFSLWLKDDLDLGWASERLNRIDIYTSTLNDMRREILRIVRYEMSRLPRAQQRVEATG